MPVVLKCSWIEFRESGNFGEKQITHLFSLTYSEIYNFSSIIIEITNNSGNSSTCEYL